MEEEFMKKAMLLFLSLVFILGVFAGCEKKTPTEPDATAPTIPAPQFSSPSATDTSQCNQMAYIYVQMANSMSLYGTIFTGQTPQQNGDTWTWQFTQGTLTMRVVATKQSSGGYQWQVILNGTDSQDGTTYNNWVALQGTSSADGKSGSWTIYEDNSTVTAAQFLWETSSAGVLTGTFTVYEQGVQSYRVVVVRNANGSGTVTHSIFSSGQWMTQFTANWAAQGAVAQCG